MTTAHRPTFDPARGKETERGPAYHQRLLPAHTKLKIRQPGQGGAADPQKRDLRAELLKAEAAHYAKLKGAPIPGADDKDRSDGSDEKGTGVKRVADRSPSIEAAEDGDEDNPETKRRKILEATRDIDADSEGSESESDEDSDEDEDDEEDETAELLRELEKIKKERAEQKEKEEREKAAEEEDRRMVEIARGNPLLNKAADFTVKRRWDDDVIFKNQARGTDDKKKPEFINDVLRSDFHKKFMSKYVR